MLNSEKAREFKHLQTKNGGLTTHGTFHGVSKWNS